MLRRSRDLETAYAEAGRKASARGQQAGSLDLLAALLEQDAVRRLAGAIVLPNIAADEAPETLERTGAEGERLAQRCGQSEVGLFHALAVLCRDTQSSAYVALAARGQDPTRLRAAALRELTAPQPKRRRETSQHSIVSPIPAIPTIAPSLPAIPPAAPANDPAPPSEPGARSLEPGASPLVDMIAAASSFPTLVGRERELSLLSDLLGVRRAGVVCIVGEPGTGKSALVQGLARRVAADPGAVPALRDADLFAAPPDVLPSQVDSPRPFILFYDAAPGSDALQTLIRDSATAIVALTPTELRRIVEAAPALVGRLAQVLLPETTREESREVLDVHQSGFARHHRVVYDESALEAAARLAPRFVSERFLPDRALVVLDLAGARARREGRGTIREAEIAGVVAESAGVPVDRLLARDTERLLAMEDHLADIVVGHGAALERIAQVVRRNYAGFRATRPVGSFLFLGPTGVGKTETAKALAEFLYGSPSAMVRLDMSEYMESHSVARLIGSPPGYVGYEDGGQLTEAVRRRPDTVVLLDEIEKAHRDIHPILLQVLDEGRLTDGRGRTVDFSNTIIVMTSNLGAGSRRAAEVLAAARRAFPIELWNRIEEPLVFEPLGAAEVAEIARRLASASSKRLERERGIRFELDDRAVKFLLQNGGFDRELGARPMRAALGRLVEAPLAEAILAGEVSPGDAVRVRVSASSKRSPRISFQKA
jgi:ATP-dependent Clp protease ATP-binding subunit ClpC